MKVGNRPELHAGTAGHHRLDAHVQVAARLPPHAQAPADAAGVGQLCANCQVASSSSISGSKRMVGSAGGRQREREVRQGQGQPHAARLDVRLLQRPVVEEHPCLFVAPQPAQVGHLARREESIRDVVGEAASTNSTSTPTSPVEAMAQATRPWVCETLNPTVRGTGERPAPAARSGWSRTATIAGRRPAKRESCRRASARPITNRSLSASK